MKHPSEATLALLAGGELGWLARLRVGRHVERCEECRDTAAEYETMRDALPELSEIPEVAWNRLAADMKANIRLGLAAGECVRTGEAPLRESPWFTNVRAAIAMASVLILLATGLMLERPVIRPADEGMVVQTTAGGIQVRKGAQAMRLMNAGSQAAIYSPDAQGSISAVSFNGDTGQVTITRVYADAE